MAHCALLAGGRAPRRGQGLQRWAISTSTTGRARSHVPCAVHRIQDATRVFVRPPPREAEPHPDGTVSFLIKGRAGEPNPPPPPSDISLCPPLSFRVHTAACFEAFTMLQEMLPAPCVFSAIEMSLKAPSDVALLIGEKGASIRHIMTESGAKVVTRPKEERSSVVALEGTPDAVQRAFSMVFETVEANRARAVQAAQASYRSSRSVAADVPVSPSSDRAGRPRDAERSPGTRSTRDSPKSYAKKDSASPSREWGAARSPKFTATPSEPPSFLPHGVVCVSQPSRTRDGSRAIFARADRSYRCCRRPCCCSGAHRARFRRTFAGPSYCACGAARTAGDSFPARQGRPVVWQRRRNHQGHEAPLQGVHLH